MIGAIVEDIVGLVYECELVETSSFACPSDWRVTTVHSVRIATLVEAEFYRDGGILQYVPQGLLEE